MKKAKPLAVSNVVTGICDREIRARVTRLATLNRRKISDEAAVLILPGLDAAENNQGLESIQDDPEYKEYLSAR